MNKQMLPKTVLVLLTVLLAGVFAYALSSPLFVGETERTVEIPVRETESTPASVAEEEPEPPAALQEQVLHKVPFTAQAPFANWDDRRYQNACEEASILMAWKWLQDEDLTAREANEAIADMVVYEQARYGFFIDSSARDTARLFRDYYNYQGVSVRTDVSIESMKAELTDGNLVIAPVNGRLLGNPNFTPPGPLRHMVAVTGYDDQKGIFITNDPGTRNGKSYEYDYGTFLNAVRDYESGDHAPITSSEKIMIVVEGID